MFVLITADKSHHFNCTDSSPTHLHRIIRRNVATSDQIEQQALGMADVMTRGIAQQFPSAFMH